MQENKLSEQVFDSLVEELLTGQHPPDLTARILAARKSEQTVGRTVSQPTVLAKPPATRWATTIQGKSVCLAVVAASLLLALVGWKLGTAPTHDDREKIAQQDVRPNPLSETKVGHDTPALAQSTDSKPNEVKQPTPPGNTTPEKIDAPFDLDSDLVSKPQTDSIPLKVVVEKLSSSEVIAEIDRRMNELWHSVEVAPAPALSPAELAQRISQTLTGQQLSDVQLSQLIDPQQQQLDTASLIASAVNSIAFENWWSQRMVQLWLGRSTQGQPESALVETLAARMNSEKHWNKVVAELIGGELKENSLTSQFFRLLGGERENHRLVECIGKNFLNQQVACMRCHKLPDSDNLAANQQSAYWSLVALLKGIEPQGQLVKDRQPELFAKPDKKRAEQSVYFELSSGVMKQAFAQLPNGQDWHSEAVAVPRTSLGKWIGDSDELDRAAVNTAWQVIFGRALVPLVPSVEVDVVGLDHRQQLLDFLAQQFDAADHDIEQLVGWIVSSRSFASQPASISRDQWIDASDEQLASQQLADLVFATGAKPTTTPLRKRLQDNLNFAVQWRSSKPNTLLAQPDQLVPGKKTAQRNKPDAPFSSSFAIHGLNHTAAEQAFVDKILRAEKLTWAARVQHVVGLSSMGLANEDSLQLSAKELLQQHSGDARAALLDLLWAVHASQL